MSRCTLPLTLVALLSPLALVLAADPPPPVPTGRLGDAVVPTAYHLDLTLLPDQPTFSGRAAIEVRVAAPTRVIYLHGNGLAVDSATLTPAGGRPLAAGYKQVDPLGVARLDFAAPVPAGPATLEFTWTAPFSARAEGPYHSTVGGASYMFTQFEDIDARRMFPGFDEPVFKTPFDITVTTRAQNVVVGNAPVLGEEPAGEGLKRVVLARTAPLPTYLVEVAVGPFDVVAAAPLPPNAVRQWPLPLRGIATRGKSERMRYALDNTSTILGYLEAYFDREYPYAKLDLIASPEFGTNAMENAGAIVYGEQRILLDATSSLDQQRTFGVIHAHEISHHWFGDLVTPKWWDDTWLNESFANWMGNKAANAWRPELQLEVTPLQEALAAMQLDSRVAARRIRQPVATSMEIGNSFDAITYLKGGGVLGMFEGYLGEEAFRAGIRLHMRRFAYGVADVEDFMASLAQGSGRPDVVPAFRSFIDQPGVPLVSVKPACDRKGARLDLAQERYLPLGSRGDRRQSWQIPMCLRYGSGKPGEPLARQCLLLKEAGTSLALTGGGCPTVVMPNAGGAGYYRFSLDEAGWRALLAGFPALSPQEGLALADSLSAAFQAGRLPAAELLAAWRVIGAAPQATLALWPRADFIRLRDALAPASGRDRVTALMRSIYRPRLDALGAGALDFSARTGPQPATAAAVNAELLRVGLVRLLALEADDADIRARLAAQARRYLRADEAEGLDRGALQPALVEAGLRAGVQDYGAPFVDLLLARMLASGDAQFRAEAAAALANTDDPALGARVRELLLDPRLRAREPTTLLFALANRASQRRATFEWFKANRPAFTATFGPFGLRSLPRLAEGFCSKPEAAEVEGYFRPLVATWPGAGRTLAETVEGIELCAALREARQADISRAL